MSITTYVIQSPATGDLKIGKTSCGAMSRLRGLQTSSPDPLKLIVELPGDQESDLHRRFADYRKSGEWFKPSPEIMDWLIRLPELVTKPVQYKMPAAVADDVKAYWLKQETSLRFSKYYEDLMLEYGVKMLACQLAEHECKDPVDDCDEENCIACSIECACMRLCEFGPTWVSFDGPAGFVFDSPFGSAEEKLIIERASDLYEDCDCVSGVGVRLFFGTPLASIKEVSLFDAMYERWNRLYVGAK